jgi:predicted acetyltransferase
MLRPLTDADLGPLTRIHAVSFGVEAEQVPDWYALAGRENVYVFDEAGRGVTGGLLDIPMGLWVGGRRLALHGVAGVAVAPEQRGRGVGRRMMAAYLERIARRAPLSALYASARSLYRQVGYGIGGHRNVARGPTERFAAIGLRDERWRPLEPTDHAELIAIRHRHGAARPVDLDRGSYVWDRVWAHRGKPNRGYVHESADGIDAWVVFRQSSGENGFLAIELVDRFATTPSALRHLAGFIGRFNSMARTIEVPCSPVDPLLDALPEHTLSVQVHEPWMLRICDVRDAIELRGFPPGLDVTLQLEVSDDVLRDNNGRFTVRIQNGEARVQAGSEGRIAMSARALGSLYTGHADPWSLRLRGEVSARDEDLVPLAAAFAGPAPVLTDFF